MTPKLYRLKYIEDGEIRLGGFAKLPLILHRLEQLLEDGMYCIVVDDRGIEYKTPTPPTKPASIPAKPVAKPLLMDAIAAYLDKPENVEKRKQAKLEDAAKWAKLRNS